MKITYSGNNYPSTLQNESFTENYFTKFYNDFKNMVGYIHPVNEPALSPEEFRDLNTVFGFDLMAQSQVNEGDLLITGTHKNIPANDNDYRNIRNITMYIVMYCEKNIQINTVRRENRSVYV